MADNSKDELNIKSQELFYEKLREDLDKCCAETKHLINKVLKARVDTALIQIYYASLPNVSNSDATDSEESK